MDESFAEKTPKNHWSIIVPPAEGVPAKNRQIG